MTCAQAPNLLLFGQRGGGAPIAYGSRALAVRRALLIPATGPAPLQKSRPGPPDEPRAAAARFPQTWLHQAAALGPLFFFFCLGKDIIQMYTVYFYTLDRPIDGRVVHVWHCSILFFFFSAVCLEPFLFRLKRCCLLLIFIYDFVHRLHPF